MNSVHASCVACHHDVCCTTSNLHCKSQAFDEDDRFTPQALTSWQALGASGVSPRCSLCFCVCWFALVGRALKGVIRYCVLSMPAARFAFCTRVVAPTISRYNIISVGVDLYRTVGRVSRSRSTVIAFIAYYSVIL